MTSGIEAGNTHESLTPVPVEVAAALIAEEKQSGLPSAADLDAVEAEKQIAADSIDAESEFESVYVTREEFNALIARIDKYNVGAPHKL